MMEQQQLVRLKLGSNEFYVIPLPLFKVVFYDGNRLTISFPDETGEFIIKTFEGKQARKIYAELVARGIVKEVATIEGGKTR